MEAAEFEQLYGMLPDALLLLSARNDVIAANRAAGELFRVQPLALQGKKLQDLSTDPGEKVSRLVGLFQSSRELVPGALVLRRCDGSELPCRIEGALLVCANGSLPAQALVRLMAKEASTSRFLALNEHIEALNREIAERRLVEAALLHTNEDLRRANSDLEQFAYSASHDLREPLRTVAIYSELVKRQYGGRIDERADQCLDLVVQSARRMDALLEGLLAFTQAAAPNDNVLTRVSADRVLDQALHNLKESIEESQASIRRDPLPTLAVREVHMLQVFQNLIGNAIKYRGEAAPSIWIKAEEERGGMWRISVHDNGIGIEPEYAQLVFGLFKRLHTSDQYSGTGIGLAICEKLVHHYNGRIWVESKGHGNGSTFYFTLPGGERS
jgi:signal transduction histidine kinase